MRHRRRVSKTQHRRFWCKVLKRLEYRGYDSCGVAVHQGSERVASADRQRVAASSQRRAYRPGLRPGTGIATPAGPTHGAPGAQRHHFSHGPGRRCRIAVVWCNGIIENHDELRASNCKQRGYEFSNQTDTERSSPTLVTSCTTATCLTAVSAAPRLKGAYAIAVFCRDEPHRVVGAGKARRW